MVKYFRKVLKNGMTVIFEQRKGCGVVSVAFATRYGSIDEAPGEKGLAHFMEHLFYKGTSNRSAKQISEEIERKGGILNGFTSEQITAYWCKMPSEHIGVALDVLGDMVRNPLFDQKEIEKERNVILEEMKMYRDAPHLHVYDKISSCLYIGTLGMSIIGTPETLGSIDQEVMRKKFEQVYSPNNMILCVVGDTEFAPLCKYVEKNFPKHDSNIVNQKFSLHNKRLIEKRRGIDQANMIFAYHIPNHLGKNQYVAQVLNTLMASGMSSRLFAEIREKRNLAYAVKGGCNIDRDFGFNSIFVGTTKENVEKVRKIIIDEFKKLKNLDEKELNEVKEQLIGNDRISKEDSQGQMLELLSYEILGKPKDGYAYEKNIRAVKLSDVKKLGDLKKYSFFALVPA